MAVMKTPGVYIVEKNGFPNSIVEVETAVPVFVGYTEKATNGTLKPQKINSLTEYQTYFGGAPKPQYQIHTSAPGGTVNSLHLKISGKEFWVVVNNNYTLYHNLLLFFANGGGSCYIVSAGNYKNQEIKKDELQKGLEPLLREQEPTILVLPEAVNLSKTDCQVVQQAMLMHCDTMKSRIALFDVYLNRYAETPTTISGSIEEFRNGIGTASSYGVAYFPWLATSVFSDNESIGEMIAFNGGATGFVTHADPANKGKLIEFLNSINQLSSDEQQQLINRAFLQNLDVYKIIVAAIKENLNLLPPSAAMAGVYTMTDNTRGVWKAPANVSLNSVIKPTIAITDSEQEELNVPAQGGKSVNAIRSFTGSGIKVWGARTLTGDDLNFRYINVRRTMIFLEASIKNAAQSYVFEPNDANTWLNMKCMIENFLRGIWKRGGLVGASPEEAYSVHVGLGETMTPEDILEGIMRITVLVAISHPAEFVEITFQQQLQKS